MDEDIPAISFIKRHGSAILALVLVLAAGTSCQTIDTRHHVLVSAAEQKMVLLEQGRVVRTYPVSTSKYGLGDKRNSYRTPVGRMVIAEKIGDGAPKGAVFKNRHPTGEVIPPDAPGRDPVLTRVLWLKGREFSTRNAYGRLIYIHGTAEERFIGKPASFGCIRMKSDDVLDLFGRVVPGTPVTVIAGHMPMAVQTANLREGMRKAWAVAVHPHPATTPAAAGQPPLPVAGPVAQNKESSPRGWHRRKMG